MSFEFANWRRITDSGIVMEGPCLLYSVQGCVSQAGLVATVYDGLDPVSGNIIACVRTTANLSNGHDFDPPLYVNRGLYVTVGDNATDVLLSYREIDDDPFKLERKD